MVAQRTIDLTPEQAQARLDALVESHRVTALWFMNPTVRAEIHSPLAQRILTTIAQNCNRAAWLETRLLRRWRSQHTS